ncbi:MAG: nuclear transport factor 2 family protein [Solirubrobacterales bacterium]|nr:nuclear transport factor 2 family protein [Solirubrobacterales bacterium]
MSNTEALVEDYIAMWNETDPDKRRSLVARTVTEDATYLDPLMSGNGIDGISAMIAGAQQQFPGHSFRLISGPDAHHDRVRFSWSLAADGEGPVAVGFDFATVADDGRMRSVTGFLEPAA